MPGEKAELIKSNKNLRKPSLGSTTSDSLV